MKEIVKKVLKFLKDKIKYINILVLFLIYGINSNQSIEVITGLWIFTLLSTELWDWFKK